LQRIINWDYNLFEWIHKGHANAVFDFVMPFVRNPYFWGPLYIFLAVLVYENFGKKALVWAILFFVVFALGDFLTAKILKQVFQRVRPFNDPQWMGIIRSLVPRGKGFSFPSTHATNHFGLATYIIITLGAYHKNIKWFALVWAILVCYAQIYVGAHYPLDIIAGALIGTWIGYVIGNYSKYNTGI
jgi:membrane-associated phospholipid phosphatase